MSLQERYSNRFFGTNKFHARPRIISYTLLLFLCS